MSLSNTWVQLAGDKIRYENSGRSKEIEKKLQDIGYQFRELATAVESGGQLLKELNMEFCQSVNVNLYMKQVFNVNQMTGESSVQKIQHYIGKIDGVKLVQVLLNQNEVHVEFDGDIVTGEDIMNVIIRIGFQADMK